MKKRVLATALAVALSAVTLAGCGGNNQQAAPAESAPADTQAEDAAAKDEAAAATDVAAGDLHFEVVSRGTQHSYWKSVQKGAETAAAELGVDMSFVGPNSESDVADQVQMIASAVNAGAAGIGVAVLDAEAAYDTVADAAAQGIPVVAFDSAMDPAPEGAVLATTATDNYSAGKCAADNMYDYLKDRIAAKVEAGESVRIGLLSQDAYAGSVANRGLGFVDEMGTLLHDAGYTVKVEGNEKFINDSTFGADAEGQVIIECLVPAQVTSELSSIDCQTLLQKADTLGIYGSNQHSGEAMVTGNETLKRFGLGEDQVVGVAFDSGAVIKGAVKDGTFLGAITQAPVNVGYMLIYTLYAIATGEDYDEFVDTGFQFYTADNMDDPEIAQNLYD